jgi:hypothetical protein
MTDPKDMTGLVGRAAQQFYEEAASLASANQIVAQPWDEVDPIERDQLERCIRPAITTLLEEEVRYRTSMESAKLLIGESGQSDRFTEAQRQGNRNQAWHILNAALQQGSVDGSR